MTSILLKRLQRDPKFRKQEAPPAPALDTTQLNDALGELIKQAAAAGAAEAVKQQPVQQAPAPAKPKAPASPAVPQHLRDFTQEPLSSEWPDPPPQAKPAMPIITMTRDAAGRIKQAHVGRMTFTVERDGADRAVRLVPSED